MQITVNPGELSEVQREHVCGFIMTYPGAGAGINNEVVGSVTMKYDAELHKQVTKTGMDEVRRLAAEQAADLATAPLPPGAPVAAPSIAAAEAFAIVPEATQATTSTVTPSAPPPPAALPENTAPTVAPPPASHVELDSAGLPWDARIHAGSKAKIANGTWRKKPGLDPATLQSVEAQLRVLMAAPAPTQVAAPQPTEAPFAAQIAAATGGPLPAPSAEQLAAEAKAKADYVALVGRTSAALNAGRITQSEIDQCCADSGVAAIPLLILRLDLVESVAAKIDAILSVRP